MIVDGKSGYQALAMKIIEQAAIDWPLYRFLVKSRRDYWFKRLERQKKRRAAAKANGKKFEEPKSILDRHGNIKRSVSGICDLYKESADLGFESPREELLEFFHSDWFDQLCGCSELITPELVREKLHIAY